MTSRASLGQLSPLTFAKRKPVTYGPRSTEHDNTETDAENHTSRAQHRSKWSQHSHPSFLGSQRTCGSNPKDFN